MAESESESEQPVQASKLCPKEGKETSEDLSSLKNGDKNFLITKTIFMVLAYITLGLYFELAGPALPDLKHKLGCNYEEISRALVVRSLGYFIGALCGGVIWDYCPRARCSLGLSVSYLIGAIGTAIIPWTPKLWLLSLGFHLQGLGQGAIDTYSNSICITMWGKKAAMPIMALHFGFGVGCVLAPQLARPFLIERGEIDPFSPEDLSNVLSHDGAINHTITYWMPTENDGGAWNATLSEFEAFGNGSAPFDTPAATSRIEIPYSISSIFTFVAAVCFIVFHMAEQRWTLQKVPPTDDSLLGTQRDGSPQGDKTSRAKRGRLEAIKTMLDAGTCANGDTTFGALFFTLLFFFFFNLIGGERVFGKFIFAFTIESSHKLSTDTAATLNTVIWLCYLAGRGVATLIAKWVSPTYMVMVELVVNLICGSVLLAVASSHIIMLWVFFSILGLSLGPLFPGLIAWANLHVELKGLAAALIFLGSASGGMFYQWLTGYLFQNHGPHSLLYVLLVYSLFLNIIFWLLLVFTRRRKRKEHIILTTVELIDSKSAEAMNC